MIIRTSFENDLSNKNNQQSTVHFLREYCEKKLKTIRKHVICLRMVIKYIYINDKLGFKEKIGEIINFISFSSFW